MRNGPEQQRSLQPHARVFVVLAETMIVALSGMTIFEIVKSLLFPDLTLWQSHIVTIVFSGVVSVIAVLVVNRKQERLHRQLRAEMREHQRKDEALHHAHEELKEILESISDAFYAVDHEWRLTYINRRAEQFWGRRREELLGKCLWQEFPQALDAARIPVRDSAHRCVIAPALHHSTTPLWKRPKW
jgi:PAS domain-containing protein